MPRRFPRLRAIAAAAFLVGLATMPAGAQQVVDASTQDLDPALASAIAKLATRDFAAPGEAQLRGIHLSRARNGRGYCGEVATAAGADFVPFHAIVEADGTASLLRLSDAVEPADKETAMRLLTNFGCLE
jgi:hypothetical protein